MKYKTLDYSTIITTAARITVNVFGLSWLTYV